MKNFPLIAIISFMLIIPSSIAAQTLQLGADRINELTNIVKNKRVALIINQTSILSDGTNLLDTLLSSNIKVIKIFAPEHGFRGNADAGETIIGGKDAKTGVAVVSLYGKNFKPTAAQLEDVDIVIFDIQDVGTRFFTYISTMHYAMEACAENGKECMVLDRPNPNDFVDGPIRELKYKSFVGMHPIPLLHGLTVGELAQMINGEGWLAEGRKCQLTVVKMKAWEHGQRYILPTNPSPNLPNDQSIRLYPSICFFEATIMSLGRGTDFAFQVVGAPDTKYGKYTFTPQSKEGAKDPKHKGKKCYGVDLRKVEYRPGLDLGYLLNFYKKSGKGAAFFDRPKYMDLLAGTNKLRLQIVRGESEETIIKSWGKDLDKYKTLRKKYLLYPNR